MSRGRARSGIETAETKKLLTVTVNGEKLNIDIKAMSLKERQLMRAALGKLEVEADWMDEVAGQVWIAMRRTDETLTFDDVLDALDVKSVEQLIWAEPEADSPEA